MITTDLKQEWLRVIQKWKLHPNKPANAQHWAPELETVSREEIRKIQGEKLKVAVKYMYEYSPLFRKKCVEKGVEPGDIRGIEDLAKLPVTTKADMSETLVSQPGYGTYTTVTEEVWKERGWQIFYTSGTTGEPRPFRYTQFDREMWTWTNARALYSMGIRSGEDVALLTNYGPHVAMWGMHYALNQMSVPIIPAGGLDTATRVSIINRYKPTVLAGTPSYFVYLASKMTEMGFDPFTSSVKRLICLGEPMPPSTKKRLEQMWNAKIHQFYGCTEVAPSCGGYTCEHGVHFMEDTHIIETLDPVTLEPVPEGERGISVVTNLCSEASPQIRFMVGDYTTLTYERCACGRTHVRALGGFAGRADDMLNIRGVTLFPSAIEDTVRQFDEFGEEFEIVLTTKNNLDEFTIVVEVLPSVSENLHDELKNKLITAVRANCELRPNVEIKPYGTLPKTEFKARRVKDLRNL